VDLRPLFEPKTVAIVGLSRANPGHPANVVYNKNILRYPVEVFPVNPKGGMYQGREVYARIGDIPKHVDLAVVAVKAELVEGVIADCIESGVGAGVVVSGGFAEAGRADLQDRIASLAREADFPFLGPNGLGVYAPGRVDTFFLPSERMIRPDAGGVAIVSQSGGVLVDQMLKFREEGVGLSVAVGIGNKALLKETDLLAYLDTDPKTRVISFYIEGFGKGEGREFVLAAEKCSKPIIVFKGGRSPATSHAISSHTASIAGDYPVFSSVIHQFGIVEAESELQLVAFCEALNSYQKPIDGRVGIVTGSGGHGALAVDISSKYGVTVPFLRPEEQDRIRAKLSPGIQKIAGLANPIDLTGSALDEDFVVAATELAARPEIECVIALLLPYLPEVTSDVGARLSQAFRDKGKPLIAYVPHEDKYLMLIEGFELNGVPVSQSIEGAILMAEALRRSKPW
jgi:acetyltransferase